MNDNINEHDNHQRGHGNDFGGAIAKTIGLVTLSILILPAMIVAGIVYLVFFRMLKWRSHVTGLLLVPLTLILYLIFNALGLFNGAIEVFKFNFSSDIIISYLATSILMGLFLGMLYILYKAFTLMRNPEMKFIKGWAQGFEYASTPMELFRARANRNALFNGEEFHDDAAPVGILEENIEKLDKFGVVAETDYSSARAIIYRYYEEAFRHTLITGATGSGKALHKDTKVPTPGGMVTVGEVEVGDLLYDEQGKPTTVTAVYQPMTPDHYEITFDNGETVKACGDHLWDVKYVGNTVSTRDIFNNMTSAEMPEVTIGTKSYNAKIIEMKVIIDSPEDYFCFTVDSPNHLFLITDSHIPTHNTISMLHLIYNDIKAGLPVAIIDFKKAPDFVYFMSKWAKDFNRPFYHFQSGKLGSYSNPLNKEQATYDPLSSGSATAKADMILSLRTWDSSSEVFKKRTQDILQSVFFLLERTPHNAVPKIDWGKGGFAEFVSALDVNNLKAMIEYMSEENMMGTLSSGDIRRLNTLINLHDELSQTRSSGLKDQINELISICRTLIVSDYGDWISKGASDMHIELSEIAMGDHENPPLVLFSFNQQEEPEFARYMGGIVMSDLSRVAAQKTATGNRTPFGVYIDEFQSLDPSAVTDSLEKSRSARIFITLSLQSIEQIVSSSDNGESQAKAILDTCANFLFHDGSGHDTAVRIAKIVGEVNRYTYKATSRLSSNPFAMNIRNNRNAVVAKEIAPGWLLEPKSIQSLSSPLASNGYKSTAYFISKNVSDERFTRVGGALPRKVRVIVPKFISDGATVEFTNAIQSAAKEARQFKEIQAEVNEEIAHQQNEGAWVLEPIDEPIEPKVPTSLTEKKTTSFQSLRNKPTQPAKNSEPKKTSGLPRLPDL